MDLTPVTARDTWVGPSLPPPLLPMATVASVVVVMLEAAPPNVNRAPTVMSWDRGC